MAPLTPVAAAWIRRTVLAYGPGGDTVPPHAGGPCACQTTSACQNCASGYHQRCVRTVWESEGYVYGPGLSYPSRARVWLGGRVCQRRCPCARCSVPAAPVPPPAEDPQLALFA